MTPTLHIAVVETPLDLHELDGFVSVPEAGGVVHFLGNVRNTNAGREVEFLFYEGYVPMAERELRKIAEEALGKWELCRVAIVHRLGRLEIGETSVLVSVSAPHRDAAFEAGRYCIDELKLRVPVWKKEHFAGGEVWIEGPGECGKGPGHRH